MSSYGDNNRQVLALPGSAGVPGISFLNATKNGMYLPAANSIGLVTNATERMRIDSSGNVGVGTSSLTSKFTVSGTSSLYTSTNSNAGSGYALAITGANAKTSTTDNTNFAIFSNDALASNPLSLAVSVVGNATTANRYAYLQASEYGTGTYSILALNPSGGNVGIGTVSPSSSAKLTLSGTSTNAALLVYNSTAGANTGLFGSVAAILGSGTSNDLAIGAFGSSNMTFYTAAAERMRVDTSGNVGIGTSTPKAQTEVFGLGQTTAALTDAGNRGGMLRVSDNNVAAGSGGAILFANSQGDTANSVGFAAIKGLLTDGGSNTAGSLAFSTRNAAADIALTERMRIDTFGNVGIGTSSTTYKLEVQGSANTYFGQRIYNTNAGSSAVSYLQIGNDTNGATAQLGLNSSTNTTNFGGANGLYLSNGLSAPIAFATAGFERMRVDGSGNVQVGGTTVGNTTGYVNSRTNTRAWARWAGSTGTIASSYNVSSVTRNSTGDYTVNYTTALADANYAVIGVTAGDAVYGGYGGYLQLKSAPTTSSCAITTRGNSGTYYDAPSVQIVVFGN